jgi:hypothetical protein
MIALGVAAPAQATSAARIAYENGGKAAFLTLVGSPAADHVSVVVTRPRIDVVTATFTLTDGGVIASSAPQCSPSARTVTCAGNLEAVYVDGGGGDDVLNGRLSVEGVTLFGGGGADRLLGSRARDLLQGDDGADQLEGGDGVDDLLAGPGDDSVDAADPGLVGLPLDPLAALRDSTVACGSGIDSVVVDAADVPIDCESIQLS